MIELRMRDGTVLAPEDAEWKITLPGGIEYTWADLGLIMLVEPNYGVVEGVFGQGMPIRGVRFTDSSELEVEVPMPLDVAREMGRLLALSKIEVHQALPTSLVFRQGRLGKS